jgi:hypothetical protein
MPKHHTMKAEEGTGDKVSLLNSVTTQQIMKYVLSWYFATCFAFGSHHQTNTLNVFSSY